LPNIRNLTQKQSGAIIGVQKSEIIKAKAIKDKYFESKKQ
jgi:hypothetical protein